MNAIRLFKCSRYYKSALDAFYQLHPEAANLDYASHYRLLMDFCFAWADFWKVHLEGTGRFVVEDVVWNAAPLQAKWAEEHGLPAAVRNNELEILFAQMRAFQPDVFFSHAFVESRPDLIDRVRREVPSVRLIIGYDGLADNRVEKFPKRDMMFNCTEFSVRAYRAQGMPAVLLPYGFEESILRRLTPRKAGARPSFIGSINFGAKGHNERARLLAYLAKRVEIDLLLNVPELSLPQLGRAFLSYLSRGELAQFFVTNAARKLGKPAVFGLPMYQALRDSSCTLNIHIDAAGTTAANIRLFEATGVGTCLVTDRKANLADYFEEDREVVAFSSCEECAEKIRWLVDHPAECDAIAQRGQARTLRDHRLQDIIVAAGDVIESALAGRPLPDRVVPA